MNDAKLFWITIDKDLKSYKHDFKLLARPGKISFFQ